jgi:PAS domain S-box-containing protein
MPHELSNSHSASISRFRNVIIGLAITFGVAVLAGWSFHVQVLKSIVAGQVAVKANTAICCIGLAVALWLVRRETHRQRAWARLSQIVAALASIVGALSFLEFSYGWDLRIDNLIFAAGVDDLPGSVRAGLMSPLAAASFFLLGISIVLLAVEARWAVWIEHVFTGAAAVTSIFGILDFLFDPHRTLTHISPATSLVLLLFSFAVLCSRTNRGLGALLASGTPGGELARRLLSAAVFVPITIGWLRWKGQEASFYSEWTGIVLMIVSSIILLSGMIVWTALVINKADAKRQEAEESARNLAAIVTSSNDGIIGKTLDGIITTWNTGAESIYGYSSKEIVGRSVAQLIPTDRVTEFRNVMRCIQQGASIRTFETIRTRKDGSQIRVALSVAPVRNAAGQVVGASTITREITEQKKIEEALHLSESRYRSLITATAQIVWTTNAQGEVIDDMPLWRAFTGMTFEQILGSGWLDSVHPDDRKRTAEVWAQAWRERARYEIEYRIRRHDGEYRDFAVRGVPIQESDGSIREWVGTCTDITDRKQAQEQLRQAALYSRTLIEASLDPLVTIGQDGKILDVNHATEKITGHPRERLIGSDFCNYFTEPEKARCGYERVFTQGSVQDYPLAIRNPDGKVVELTYNATVFTNEAGAVQGVFAAARDVTRMKAAEQEVRRLNQELEQRVMRRTAQLEAANKELEAFTYSVSHDLRAPLRHISGFAKILIEDFASQIPEEAKHHLQRIEEGTHRMGQLVDDLLNLARVGRRELNLQVTGFTSLVDEVIAGLQSDLGHRRVEWKIGDLPYMDCDPALMHQVFQNLLSNAVKFTRPREVARVEIGREMRDGTSVVYVRDNGVGFSMKYSDKLFGVFQRLHRVEDFEGTGVGLATVQRIIQKHGGRIWAEAELDKGATFYFTLGNSGATELKTNAMLAGDNA